EGPVKVKCASHVVVHVVGQQQAPDVEGFVVDVVQVDDARAPRIPVKHLQWLHRLVAEPREKGYAIHSIVGDNVAQFNVVADAKAGQFVVELSQRLGGAIAAVAIF